MKIIYLDFNNRIYGHNFGSDSNGTQYMADKSITKRVIKPYLPDSELYDVADCFSFDFEKNEVSLNRPIIYPDEKSEIYPLTGFVPIKIYAAPGLCDKYDQFLADIGMEQVNLSEDPEYQAFISDFFRQIM